MPVNRPYNTPLFTGTGPTSVSRPGLSSSFPFQSPLTIDIESTGLSNKAITTEISLFDPSANKIRTWVIDPSYAGVSREQFASLIRNPQGSNREISTWFINKVLGVDTEPIYERFGKPKFDTKGYKSDLTKALPGVDISVKETSFTGAVGDIVTMMEKRGSGVISAHNVPFDFGTIGRTLREIGTPEAESLINRLSNLAETAPAMAKHRGTLFETGEDLQLSKALNLYQKDPLSIIHAYSRTKPSKWAVRDSLTLARAVIEIALKKPPVGIASMDVIAAAMGLDTKHGHLSAVDVYNENKAQEFLSGIAKRISTGKQFTNEQNLFFSKLEAARPLLAKQAVAKSLIEARGYFELGQQFRFAGQEEKLFRLVTGKGTTSVPMISGADIVPAVIPFNRTTNFDRDDAADFQKLFKKFVSDQEYDVNLKEIDSWVNRLEKDQLENTFHSNRLFGTIQDVMKKVKPGKFYVVEKPALKKVFNSHLGDILKRPEAAAIVGIGLAAMAINVGLSKLSHDKDEQLDVRGLPEEGLGPEMRHVNTEFGSGWQGLYSAILPASLQFHSPESIDRRMDRYYRTIWQNPGRRLLEEQEIERRQKKLYQQQTLFDILEASPVEDPSVFEGINRSAGGKLYSITLNPDKYAYEFDDADTLVVKRKGWHGMPNGKGVSIRLAGIDSPEVGGHELDPLKPVRIAQNQPYGRVAANAFRTLLESQESLTMVFDPNQTTYGRHVGVLFGDQMQNLNLTLVKQGMAAYLPYGQAEGAVINRFQFGVAEQRAYALNKGMWKEPFWQAYKMHQGTSGKNVTFNTFTRMDKLADNRDQANLMMMMWTAQHQGYVSDDDVSALTTYEDNRLRYTHGRFGKTKKGLFKYDPVISRVAGDYSMYNTITGMQHNAGFASGNRPQYGFGSSKLPLITPNMIREALGRSGTARAGFNKAVKSSRSGWQQAAHTDIYKAMTSIVIGGSVSRREAKLLVKGLDLTTRSEDIAKDMAGSAIKNARTREAMELAAQRTGTQTTPLPDHGIDWAHSQVTGNIVEDTRQADILTRLQYRANIQPSVSWEEMLRLDSDAVKALESTSIKEEGLGTIHKMTEEAVRLKSGGNSPSVHVSPSKHRISSNANADGTIKKQKMETKLRAHRHHQILEEGIKQGQTQLNKNPRGSLNTFGGKKY